MLYNIVNFTVFSNGLSLETLFCKALHYSLLLLQNVVVKWLSLMFFSYIVPVQLAPNFYWLSHLMPWGRSKSKVSHESDAHKNLCLCCTLIHYSCYQVANLFRKADRTPFSVSVEPWQPYWEKWARYEVKSIIRFSWTKGVELMEIYREM